MGDIEEKAFKVGGNTSTGTQTPPTADKITTEMAATGNAWLEVLKIVPISIPNETAQSEIQLTINNSKTMEQLNCKDGKPTKGIR